MKRVFLGMAVMAATVFGTVSAQSKRPQGSQQGERPSREVMQQQRQQKMVEELGLTESQAKQLAAINEDFAKECKSTSEKSKASMAKAKENRANAMAKLLTKEQMAKMIEMQKGPGKGKKGAPGKGQGRKGGRPMPQGNGAQAAK